MVSIIRKELHQYKHFNSLVVYRHVMTLMGHRTFIATCMFIARDVSLECGTS